MIGIARLAPPPPPRPVRWGRLALAALAAAAALHAAARAVAAMPGVEARLRERIASSLRARLGEVSVGGPVSLDWALRPSFGPIAVPAPDGSATPVLAVENARVRPGLLALLRGRLEPAAIELRGVRLSPGPGGRALRALAHRLRGRAGERTGDGPGVRGAPTLRVRGMVIALPRGAGETEVGPFDADASATSGTDATHVAVGARLAGGGRADLALERSPRGWRFRLSARDLGPAALPQAFLAGPARLDGGALSLDLEGEAAPDLSTAAARLDAFAEGVVLAGERLGGELGPLDVRAAGSLAWDGAGRRASLRDGRVTIQGVLPVRATAELLLASGEPFAVSLAADGVSYRALAAALPAALAPPAAAPRPGGTFDARLGVEGPIADPSFWSVSASFDLSRMREAARREPPVALRASFEHRPPEAGRPPAFVVGPENPDFVPIAELPEHVVRAVTTSEDAGFFGHQGFDFEELRNAVAQGAEAGRVVRGGSTITQQVAKNLFLSQERTVARKVREALVTIALEASVPKRRLLEIYLNVAEWGPGLWGIGPAARHWFGKDARTLTPKEAAFLASIIPNPVRYHSMFARGAPTDAWEERVDELLLKMTIHGAISDDDLSRALREPIVFGGG